MTTPWCFDSRLKSDLLIYERFIPVDYLAESLSSIIRYTRTCSILCSMSSPVTAVVTAPCDMEPGYRFQSVADGRVVEGESPGDAGI